MQIKMMGIVLLYQIKHSDVFILRFPSLSVLFLHFHFVFLNFFCCSLFLISVISFGIKVLETYKYSAFGIFSFLNVSVLNMFPVL